MYIIYCDIPWSVFWRYGWGCVRCNGSKPAWFYGLYAFEVCCSVDGLDKSRMTRCFEDSVVCDLVSRTHWIAKYGECGVTRRLLYHLCNIRHRSERIRRWPCARICPNVHPERLTILTGRDPFISLLYHSSAGQWVEAYWISRKESGTTGRHCWKITWWIVEDLK